MSTITDLKTRAEAEIMEPRLSGDSLWYVEARKPLGQYRCDGCGLVWAIKWHAETCESRKHRARWEQVYTVRAEGFSVTGQYKQVGYERVAIRRDRVEVAS